MRIAQIAPVIESVPPHTYGGTERVVSYLTEELVQAGHEVTLFASADSATEATLVPTAPMANRLDPERPDPVAQHMCMLDEVASRAADFDVLHFHVDIIQFPVFRKSARKTLTTLHGRQDFDYLRGVYRRFSQFPLISISDNQRGPLPEANFVGTVYHGLPQHLHAPTLNPRGGYLAFLGRISPEKGVERAIELARRAGIPLKIAAKVDRADQTYFEERVKPLLAEPGIEFIGEIGEGEKTRFLGDALGLLFPIDWPEPFGLVMIEAFACGTPVLAFRRGSVPEVLDDGWSGVVVETVDEAVAALPRLLALDRAGVRRVFDERFTAGRMAQDYVEHYRAAACLETETPKRPIRRRSVPLVGKALAAGPAMALGEP